jgi:Uma2 family endonuclease
MGKTLTRAKRLKPGTTGWTVDDLDNPRIESRWVHGRYEIIQGVLTTMPAAYFEGSVAITKLIFAVMSRLRATNTRGEFATELDIVIDPARVVKGDAAFLSPDDRRRQGEAAAAAGRADVRRTRILIPPTLVIESVSPGHELHDEQTKRRWYAEFGVRHYWILNAFERTLRCLSLRGAAYAEGGAGRESDLVRPSTFPGLVIRLADVWAE